jgi:hypothetical protein
MSPAIHRKFPSMIVLVHIMVGLSLLLTLGFNFNGVEGR